MPSFITARLFLEEDSRAFGEHREQLGSLYLDEGFDNPAWRTEGPAKNFLVPASVETMMVDGLLKLFADCSVISIPKKSVTLRDRIEREAADQDLLADYFQTAVDCFQGVPKTLTVSLVLYSDSTLRGQLEVLDALPNPTRLFRSS